MKVDLLPVHPLWEIAIRIAQSVRSNDTNCRNILTAATSCLIVW